MSAAVVASVIAGAIIIGLCVVVVVISVSLGHAFEEDGER